MGWGPCSFLAIHLHPNSQPTPQGLVPPWTLGILLLAFHLCVCVCVRVCVCVNLLRAVWPRSLCLCLPVCLCICACFLKAGCGTACTSLRVWPLGPTQEVTGDLGAAA